MKRTIRDFELNGKKVIIRCDFNVPMKNGVISDDNKIKESLETIKYALDNEAKVILMSHLGKIKEEKDKINNTLEPVSKRLTELLNIKVLFSFDTRSNKLTEMVNNLKNGEVLLIENTRFEDINNKKESSCDLELSTYWASLGDIFINDAYGTAHRAHASNVGIAKLLPNGIGFLVEKEINKIDGIINENTHPFVIIMGGKKVSDKILLIEKLITKCDKLLIGGGMAFTFLKAKGYNVGNSIVEIDHLEICKNIIDKYSDKLILPVDFIVTDEITDNPIIVEKDISNFSSSNIGVDIGTKTRMLFISELKDSKRVVMNGPMGIFEIDSLSLGTKEIYDYLIKENIKTLIGGGETAESVKKFNYKDKFYHVSTGGGATLEYLEGKDLPGISVIENEI